MDRLISAVGLLCMIAIAFGLSTQRKAVKWRPVLIGTLLGEKTVLNEFVAYAHLHQQMETLSPRTVTILTYALCGFSNFSSVAIQIGGIGALAPTRRHDLSRLGLRALVAGTLACFMTACVAGMLI